MQILAAVVCSVLALACGAAATQCPVNRTVSAILVPPSPWTPGTPYCVVDNVTLSNLAILPGVRVEIRGNFTITIGGSVSAVGTEFVSAPGFTGGWGGLEFNSPSATVFEDCLVSDANRSAVRIRGHGPVLRRCVFARNAARRNAGGTGTGGAIWADLQDVDTVIEDCWFVCNQADWHGGAVDVQTTRGARLVLRRCRLVGNWANTPLTVGASEGGAVRVAGDLLAEDCVFHGNRVHSYCNAWNCSVTGRGGALALRSGSATLVRCAFLANANVVEEGGSGGNEFVYGRGGVIWFDSPAGTLLVEGCVLGGNELLINGADAHAYGTGIYGENGTLRVVNSTIARQSMRLRYGRLRARAGGAVYWARGSLEVRNSIAFENREYWNGATVPEPLQVPIQYGAGVSVLVEYSCVEIGFAGMGNISSNPQFAFPGTGCGSLLVRPSSPCVDGGDPAPGHDDAVPIVAGSAPRNDMGAHGGPGNRGWERRANPFALAVHPQCVSEVATLGSTYPRCAAFAAEGGHSGLPALLAIVGVNGLPWSPPLDTGIIDIVWSSGDWLTSLVIPDSISAATFTFVAVSIDPNFNLLVSPPVTLKVR